MKTFCICSPVWIFILVIFSTLQAYPQPYFDPAGITGWTVPGNDATTSTSEIYGIVFLSMPLNAGSNNKLVFSPFYENRKLGAYNRKRSVSLQSACLPVTFLRYSTDTTWTISGTFIARANSTDLRFNGDVWQFGGVILNTVRIRPNFKLKFGLYYNREFFSDFFIPLAGIEWRISEKINLFGTLPNLMKLEYRVSAFAYAGIAFKSITNSYRYGKDDGYYKIEDNHLGLYADFYLPAKIVFMVEAGHTIFREINNRSLAHYPGFREDSFIFKTGLYYRIRLDDK